MDNQSACALHYHMSICFQTIYGDMQNSNTTMLLNVTIFGYSALPVYHADNGNLWLTLPTEYFADPDIVRKSAKLLTYTEPQMVIAISVFIYILGLYVADYFVKNAKGLRVHCEIAFPSKVLCVGIGSLFLTPVATVIVVLSFSYRLLVHKYLKLRIGEKYIGLLKGPDVLWALATEEAKSAVNVLVVVEAPSYHESNYNFLRFVRKVAATGLLAESNPFPKLLYRRGESKLGYYFWKESDDTPMVEDYVRRFDLPEGSNEEVTKNDLEDIVAEHCNSPFPFGDTATWEILVGDKPLLSLKGEQLYPIIFRVHHSVGDGIALLRLLLEGLADKGKKELPASSFRQQAWVQSHKEATEEIPEIIINVDAKETLLQIESTSIQPFISSNSGAAVNEMKNMPLFREHTPSNRMALKPALQRLKNSFRLLRHRPIKTELKFEQKEPLPPKISRQYAPIKGLGTATMKNTLSTARLLTRSSSFSRETIRTKNTCIIQPVTWKQDSSLSLNDCFPSKYETRQGFKESCTQSIKFEPESSKTISDDFKYGESLSAESCPIIFAKCKSNNKKEINSNSSTSRIDCEKPNIPQNHENASSQVRPNLRDIALSLVVAVIASIVCVKNSMQSICADTSKFVEKVVNFAFAVPYMLFDQAFGRTEDIILHGKPLTGEKIVTWISESDVVEDGNLMKYKIRKIRDKLGKGLRFSDILMACVSRSLEKHYIRSGGPVPSFVNVVLPARVNYDDIGRGLETTAVYKTSRLTAKVTRIYNSRQIMKAPFKWQNLSFNSSTESEFEEQSQKKAEVLHAAMTSPTKIKHKAELENKFTVALLKLPIHKAPKKMRNMSDELKFIQSIQAECEKLRNSPDYLVNYWLLRWVAHLFPSFLIKPFLSGGPCSLVLSNLPGPEDPVYLSGRRIRNIAFWVPNRGMNGLGIGMLSYCDRFSMGIIADKALISGKEEAKAIINGIFEEVERLHNSITKTRV